VNGLVAMCTGAVSGMLRKPNVRRNCGRISSGVFHC